MSRNKATHDEQGEERVPRRWWQSTKGRLGALAGTIAVGVVTGVLINLLTPGAQQSLRRIVSGDDREIIIKDKKGPILGVHIEQGDADGCNARGWIYPDPPTAPIMNTPPGSGPRRNGKTWDEDPAAFGAAPAGPVTLYISARARDERAIIIHNISFHVVERREPIRGTRISLAAGCGDSPTYHVGRVNFGAKAPYWVPAGDFMGDFRKDELKFPYQATASDPATLLIDVNPGRCHCTWNAKLSWTDGSEHGTTVIDDKGKPFHVTSSSGLPIYTWQEGRRVRDDKWSQ